MIKEAVGSEGRKVKGKNEPGRRQGRLVYEPYRRRVEEMLEEQERLR
ncbi:hypothetical protein KDK_57500 [Dictyobacter kobayashii]|uniref:Uncharacterized protein n=1 Tax=Dictyobacter kobayashii TaxID=2014872 RepID=A0A402AS72_9CHLR|nr:hypothetical protein KDK_57500 [Dictyobacter kobayashii]